MNRFEEIYSENFKSMYYVAVKMVGNRSEVNDIVQEVFISLFDKLQNGNNIHNPKSWLYRTTSNKCIDFLKRQKRFQNIDPLETLKTEGELIEKQEVSTSISFALSKLKPKEKMLAVLYSEGLSYKEIAEASGIKFSSIGKMLSRTLKKLEQELKNQTHELS